MKIEKMKLTYELREVEVTVDRKIVEEFQLTEVIDSFDAVLKELTKYEKQHTKNKRLKILGLSNKEIEQRKIADNHHKKGVEAIRIFKSSVKKVKDNSENIIKQLKITKEEFNARVAKNEAKLIKYLTNGELRVKYSKGLWQEFSKQKQILEDGDFYNLFDHLYAVTEKMETICSDQEEYWKTGSIAIAAAAVLVVLVVVMVVGAIAIAVG